MMSHERLLDASWRSKKKKDVHQTLIDHPVSIGLLLHFLDEKTFILLQNFNFVLVLFACLFVYFRCDPKVRNYYFQYIIC